MEQTERKTLMKLEIKKKQYVIYNQFNMSNINFQKTP